jgi:hypothetical protein
MLWIWAGEFRKVIDIEFEYLQHDFEELEGATAAGDLRFLSMSLWGSTRVEH